MKLSEVKERMRVRYMPGVAMGFKNHEACEDGTVSSWNDKYIFVKFDQQLKKFGWEGTTSQSCDPRDLIAII